MTYLKTLIVVDPYFWDCTPNREIISTQRGVYTHKKPTELK